MRKKIFTLFLTAAILWQGVGSPSLLFAQEATLPVSSEESGYLEEGTGSSAWEEERSEELSEASEEQEGVDSGEDTQEGTVEENTQSAVESEGIAETPGVEQIITESTEAPTNAEPAWSHWILGSTGAAILGGGRLASAPDGTLYFSNIGEGTVNYYDESGRTVQLAQEEGHSLNAFEGAVYYVSESGNIQKWDRVSQAVSTVLEWGASISQMYVVNEEVFFFLSEGNIYLFCPGNDVTEVRIDGAIQGFIPTEQGMLYAKGEALNWDIWAEDQLVKEDVSAWDLTEGYLVMTIEGQDYQMEISQLFFGYRSAVQLENYQLGEACPIDELLGEGEECAVCAENARKVADGELVVEEMETLSVEAVSQAYTAASNGQKNIIKRARQQEEIKWTPLADIAGWGNTYTFSKGVTYQGLPYGQPVYARYIPFDTSYNPSTAAFQEFANAVNDPTSKMYTSQSKYNKVAPYYSSDCSSFVSYAWDLYKRETSVLPGTATKVANQSVYSVQLGDIFNRSGVHVVLVADIGYGNDGTIQFVDILEQTPPKVRRTRYGVGGSGTLAQLEQKYLGSGYSLYRYEKKAGSYNPGRDAVKYTHSCVVPIDKDYCDSCEDLTLHGFVKRLYRLILGRTAKESEVNSWVKVLEDGKSTGTDVAYGFIFSVEYDKKNVSARQYVSHLYQTMMGRTPKETEIQAWVDVLNCGFTRHMVFSGFANSAEFQDICQRYEIKRGSYSSKQYVDIHEPVTRFVARLYHICLQRNPKTEEAESWVRALVARKGTGSEVAYGFFFSSEFQSRKYSDTQYVTYLYQACLGREPDTEGLQAWVKQLKNGKSRKTVFYGFANSVEFQKLCDSYGIKK
ncbi:DUF4214 domain-containing protein [Hominifimenecus sp. rT4P-3]|uniref:DUF4214 domain-containing protein n=1 Tax=Hominifimenecus sp. rT4P-3 TaxID=3242979 RepID=UPI003DA3E657